MQPNNNCNSSNDSHKESKGRSLSTKPTWRPRLWLCCRRAQICVYWEMASKPCVLCDRILHMLMHLIALMCGWVGESQHEPERLDNCLFKSHPQSFRHSAWPSALWEEAAFVKPWLEGYLMEHQCHWCRMMLIVKVLFCFGHLWYYWRV